MRPLSGSPNVPSTHFNDTSWKFGKYVPQERPQRGGFLPIFWDVPHANIHAVEDIEAVVDWLTERCEFHSDAKSNLAVLHNRNDITNCSVPAIGFLLPINLSLTHQFWVSFATTVWYVTWETRALLDSARPHFWLHKMAKAARWISLEGHGGEFSMRAHAKTPQLQDLWQRSHLLGVAEVSKQMNLWAV